MGRRGRLAVLSGVLAVVAAALLAATGHRWEAPALAELDLGAADADAAAGTWAVRELVVGGTAVPLVHDSVLVDIDTRAAVLTADAGCNILLGSFTLLGSGAASFTVPSARFQRCPAAATAQEDALLEALARTSAWEERDGRLLLTGPGTRLELRRLDR